MATDQSFVEYIIDQAGLGERLTCRKMFGEYAFHLDGKFVAMACDNTLFLKRTPAIEKHGLDCLSRPPYPGASPYPVIDELPDDPEQLHWLLMDTATLLPAVKPKKAKPKDVPKRR